MELIIIKKVYIPSPFIRENDVVERLSNSITPKTKAISFCHITRGGHLYHVKKIASMAKDRNILTLVDEILLSLFLIAMTVII